MHLVTYLHPRLPTDSAEEPAIYGAWARGAEVKLFNLDKVQFPGWIDCFQVSD